MEIALLDQIPSAQGFNEACLLQPQGIQTGDQHFQRVRTLSERSLHDRYLGIREFHAESGHGKGSGELPGCNIM